MKNTKKPRKGHKLVKSLFGKYEEIPEEWEVTPTSGILKITMGQSPPSESYNQEEKGLPFYQGVTDFGTIYPNPTVWCTDSRKIAEENSILFSVRAPVGEINITKKKCCLGRGIAALNSLKNDLLYCYYLVQQNKNRFLVYSQGTTYDAINRNEIEKTKLPYTKNIKEQQKIASILSRVDALIESTQKVIEKAERLKKALMQKLLTRGIGHKKFKKIPWLFGKEIEIPEGWNYERIIDNSTLKGRIGWQGLTTDEYNQQGEFYLVTGTDFKDGRIDWKNCVYVDEERYSQDANIQLKKEDVLVTKDGTIGKIAYVDTTPSPATLNSGVFVIRPVNKEYLPLFLFYILYSSYFIKFLNRLKAGSTINHLYQKDFVNFKFPLPSVKEQQKIASILSGVDSYIQKNQQYKEKLEILKKGLMQKLLTGQIRVNV